MDKIGEGGGGGNIADKSAFPMHAQIFENSRNFAPTKHEQIASTDFPKLFDRKVVL